MNKKELAGLSTQERKIVSHFSATEQNTINADKLIAFHPCQRATANQILRRLAQKGWLHRLKYGMYTIVPLTATAETCAIENAWPLAMDLFEPAYISGWSAAEHWNLTEQIFNSISVSTLSPQRKRIQLLGAIKFRVKIVKKGQYFGTKKIWFGSKAVELADPSRMLVDILDLPRFGGGGRHMIDVVKQYWRADVCKPDILLEYALRYKRGVVFKRLGFLAEVLKAPVSEAWLNTCRLNISKGISCLDPDGPQKGKIVSKWNLKINLPI